MVKEKSGAAKVHEFLKQQSIGYEYTNRSLMDAMNLTYPGEKVGINIVTGFMNHAVRAGIAEIVGKTNSSAVREDGRSVRHVYLYRLIDHGDELKHKGPGIGTVPGRQNRAKKVKPKPDLPVLEDIHDDRGNLITPFEPRDMTEDKMREVVAEKSKDKTLSERMLDLAIEVGMVEALALERVSTEALVDELHRRIHKEKKE